MDTCARCGVDVPSDPGWCPQCLEVPKAPEPRASSIFAPPEDTSTPRLYSRTRAGTLSYGWLGRLGVSLLLLAAGFYAQTSMVPFFAINLIWPIASRVVVGAVVAYGLWRVWRPARVG
jgi:hypothetical protein